MDFWKLTTTKTALPCWRGRSLIDPAVAVGSKPECDVQVERGEKFVPYDLDFKEKFHMRHLEII